MTDTEMRNLIKTIVSALLSHPEDMKLDLQEIGRAHV